MAKKATKKVSKSTNIGQINFLFFLTVLAFELGLVAFEIFVFKKVLILFEGSIQTVPSLVLGLLIFALMNLFGLLFIVKTCVENALKTSEISKKYHKNLRDLFVVDWLVILFIVSMLHTGAPEALMIIAVNHLLVFPLFIQEIKMQLEKK